MDWGVKYQQTNDKLIDLSNCHASNGRETYIKEGVSVRLYSLLLPMKIDLYGAEIYCQLVNCPGYQLVHPKSHHHN